LPPGYYIEIYPDVEIYDETEQLVAEYWIHDPENEFEASPGLDCGFYKWKITPLGFDDMSSINCFFCTPVEFARFEFDDGSCEPPDTDPVVTAETIYDSPCREGPGDEYPIQSYILEGEIATLLGHDIENNWWVIEDPLNPEWRCWIIQNVVIAEGLTSELPILSAPKLPGGSGSDGNGSGGSPVCKPNLSPEECKAAGGTYNINAFPPCNCP
jgi:hypothetical protein